MHGNRELLRSAIENVLRNAVRYSPPGAAVEVAVESGAGGLAVTIRDRGPGVPQGDLERIFEPFFRVAESRDRDSRRRGRRSRHHLAGDARARGVGKGARIAAMADWKCGSGFRRPRCRLERRDKVRRNVVSLYQEACKYIPGGVNSPVRAFRGVGGEPIFFKQAAGAHVVAADGRRFIDYVGSWGPMILGHAHPHVIAAVRRVAADGLSFGAPTELETVLARRVTELMPSIELVRFVSSGTEATMSAIRLARGFTGRETIVKFEGCYHGHSDSLLIKAGSGALTFGVPTSPGVPRALAAHTVTLNYNDSDQVRDAFRQIGGRNRLRHRRAGRRQHELRSAGPGFPRDLARGVR